VVAGPTFCFTDVVGSTTLVRSLGVDLYIALLERHRVLVRDTLADVGGEEVRVEGDGFFLAFDEPSKALAFAVAAQRALSAEAWPEGVDFRVRVGIHRGAADRRPDGDYLGLGVHRAARVAALAGGGQVLVTRDTADESVLPPDCRLRSIGRYHVRDFDGPTELLQLVGPGLPDGFAPLRAVREGSGLPLPSTGLLGRDDELDRVVDLLGTAPVVTLVGTGGVGKTRLALEVAALAAPDHPGGSHVVELSAVPGPDDVLAAIAAAVGARAGSGEDLEDVLLMALAGARHLVLLDSCERVLDGVAAAIELLARRSPGTTLLATSVEAVRIPGERVVPIAPLGTGDADADDPRELAAVRLILERVVAAGGDIDPTRDARNLAEIARRLDGIPLALELAASRVAEVGVDEVLASLDDRFAVLTGGYRTALPRHRTLEAAVAWSADLLKPDDRHLLARLSRILGRWEVESALDVAEGHEVALARLVDRSLVVVDGGRVRLLDTVRAFMRRELGAEETTHVDRRRLVRIRADVNALTDSPEGLLVDAMHHRIADAREAIDALAASEPDLAAHVAICFVPWFEWTGRRHDGLTLLQRVAAAFPEPSVRSLVLAGQAELLSVSGRADEAKTAAAAALAIPEAPARARALAMLFVHPVSEPLPPGVPDPLVEAEGLARTVSQTMTLAVQSRRALRSALEGDVEAALTTLRDIADTAHVHGFWTHEAQALLNRGGFLARTGRFEEAERDLEAGEAIAEEVGLVATSKIGLISRATIALHRGDPARALALAEERLSVADAIDDARGMPPALSIISAASIALGDLERAAVAGERMIALARLSGDVEAVVVGSFNLVVLAAQREDVAAGARAASEALTRSRGLLPLERLAVVGVAGLAARAGLDDALALVAAVGDELDRLPYLDPGDRAWVTEGRAALAASRPVDVVAREEARGAAMPWEEVCALASETVVRLAQA
jgi:predicted ATPase/class 3 adenylate cyclase